MLFLDVAMHDIDRFYAQLHVIMSSIDFSCVDSLQLGVNSKSRAFYKARNISGLSQQNMNFIP